jgi:hypothetical protein
MKLPFPISLMIITATFIHPVSSIGTDYNLHPDPQFYILSKFQSHDIVFLGTRHRQPPILKVIGEIIPNLHDAGVTHVGLEIASDQQDKIDHFLMTGTGLFDIEIPEPIDCPEYRDLFSVLRTMSLSKRPTPVALDLPKSEFSKPVSRDDCMAKIITALFRANPKAKMLVVVGNLHVLKKLDWQDHVPNKHRAIREYPSESLPALKMFSVGQVIGKSVCEDDLQKRFGAMNGAVAVDLDQRFAGWRSEIVQSVATKPAEVWELLDRMVVY